ncbi:MAG TPA: hypothetical protein V6D28_14775 [Leptolyngbyaceae cyanobacterium]
MAIVALLILLGFWAAIPLGLAWWLNKRYKIAKLILFAIAGLLVVIQTSLWLYDFSGMQANDRYSQIKTFLNQPFSGLQELRLSQSKAIIALSFMSEGLVSYAIQNPEREKEVVSLLEKAVQIAFHPDISPRLNLQNVTTWKEEGLYLSHLNAILGSYQRLSSDRKYFQLNQTISEHLAQKILNEPYHNIRSYTKATHRWPADNAVTLHSLYLFDRNNNTQISDLPIKKWLEYMRIKGSEPTTKLHYSELTGVEKYSPYPRGCALSWTTKYISDFAPQEAIELWQNYKKHYHKNFLIISGFREYTPNVNLQPDADSGPIIFGIGAGATGLALNGAKYVGDYLTYYQINNVFRMADLVGNILSYFGRKELQNLSQDILATAIRFNAETKVKWY